MKTFAGAAPSHLPRPAKPQGSAHFDRHLEGPQRRFAFFPRALVLEPDRAPARAFHREAEVGDGGAPHLSRLELVSWRRRFDRVRRRTRDRPAVAAGRTL